MYRLPRFKGWLLGPQWQAHWTPDYTLQVKHESTICNESLDHAQGKVDMILELFLDCMTTNFSDRVVIGERTENELKAGKVQNATTCILPVYPQEQYLLPHKKPTQANQKQKQKQTNKGNNDRERRRPHFDSIPISYTHLLPIMIHVRAIVPKEIENSRIPYLSKHDPNATYGYHSRYIGHIRNSITSAIGSKDRSEEVASIARA
ncbi:hypothetical protein KIW84_053424 [Lathyrus oleraceus]|uniref:Uncharacterized protein n=1 Tax=Pisum sativum TaxID=3888 RepID=A0A9D5ADA0_PEA|nr:hypothetical protein KIW84_053424 [Pisum sativum]